MVASGKAIEQNLFKITEPDNVNAIYWLNKARIKDKADFRVYNHNLNILEGDCNFRRGLFLERGRDLSSGE
jgi:hypothetical protein